MEIKLVPLKEKHMHSITGKLVETVEQVLIYHNDYPMFLVHSDFIWDLNKVIYDKLMEGEEVNASISLGILE